MTKTNMANPEEDQFKESLITLLNGQQDLQKQSLKKIWHTDISMIISWEIFQYMLEKIWN